MTSDDSTAIKLFDSIWASADKVRGRLAWNEFTRYLLAIFFLKYISDQWKEATEQNSSLLKEDPGAFLKVMTRERFVLPGGIGFDYVVSVKLNKNIGNIINEVLHSIEKANSCRLSGIFSNIDFNDSRVMGEGNIKTALLSDLISLFEAYDFQSSSFSNTVISRAFSLLLEKLFFHAGKEGNAWSTPPSTANLLAKLMKPKRGDTIYDPACGTAGLLIRTLLESDGENESRRIYGQEINSNISAIAGINLLIHGMDDANIEWGDSINFPKFFQRNDPNLLMQFDIVVSNPPISLNNWWRGGATFNRFDWGIPPNSKGEYAFILHMLASALENKGRVGVIAGQGVLFRKGVESDIRKKIIENNLLEAVISLPSNLLYDTSIPFAILLFNKGRGDNTGVLFIDAGREFGQDKRKNFLTQENIDHIVSTYEAFKAIPQETSKVIQEGYSYIASREEIEANEYNISIPRYVNSITTIKLNVDKTRAEIDMLDIRLAHIKDQIKQCSKELGL